MYDLFLEYAENNGWWRKEYYKKYEYKEDFIRPDGGKENRTFKIFTPTDFESYPYIDTFTYGGDGYITNNSYNTEYTFSETDGY